MHGFLFSFLFYEMGGGGGMDRESVPSKDAAQVLQIALIALLVLLLRALLIIIIIIVVVQMMYYIQCTLGIFILISVILMAHRHTHTHSYTLAYTIGRGNESHISCPVRYKECRLWV